MARFHELEVAEVRRETDECVTIRFDVPDELKPVFAYQPGQHLILKTELNGEEIRRTYSICSAAQDQELRICVKQQPEGRFSTFANRLLAPGSRIAVMPPAGRFTLPPDPSAERTYVAFCAGSGITPIFSILKTALTAEPKSRFVLVYGSRTTSSIIFREELEDLKNRFLTRLSIYHVLSREPQDIDLLNGRIDARKVRAFCRAVTPPAAVDAWFLCGPAPMIGEAARTLEELGVDRRRIHFEYFTPEGNEPRPRLAGTIPAAAREGASRVTVVLEGRQGAFDLPFDGTSILDGARAAGIDAPYSCKAGVCSTCRAKVVAGKVDMAVNYALEDWEVEAGFVLTCQSRPLSPEVVVDYDAS
ncbi:1,2-phenylacetyl-CoA epoxidase subunit PaaE [Benzoatithermus flavus]|uniref:1,2-phenylacetyl-CoA epoxidase subunit PaaE n=1 Tax=Benzoatithermus flavus TaxID=3108223 RepID=A0ABU8XWP6_9PROT